VLAAPYFQGVTDSHAPTIRGATVPAPPVVKDTYPAVAGAETRAGTGAGSGTSAGAPSHPLAAGTSGGGGSFLDLLSGGTTTAQPRSTPTPITAPPPIPIPHGGTHGGIQGGTQGGTQGGRANSHQQQRPVAAKADVNPFARMPDRLAPPSVATSAAGGGSAGGGTGGGEYDFLSGSPLAPPLSSAPTPAAAPAAFHPLSAHPTPQAFQPMTSAPSPSAPAPAPALAPAAAAASHPLDDPLVGRRTQTLNPSSQTLHPKP
jgi:hypothetical protein